MPTISSKISEAEHRAILEYANECGLNVSDLVKKIVCYEICFLGGDLPDEAAKYAFHPTLLDESDDNSAFLNHVNNYREMLGISPLK
ncbi:MAG: hypothetical protein ACREBU_23285 [Nitrososphaera sp.]